MGRKAIIAIVAVCLSAPALCAASGPEQTSDTQLFFQGLALSYNGDHDAARAKFAEYDQRHPDDLLARLRTFDDRMFDIRSNKLSKEEYRHFLADVNAAIATYEEKGCSGTDLKGIGDGTLDCDYIAAALYSMRMALYLRNESKWWVFNNRKMLRGEDDRFFFYARRSKSLQAKFLLGVHEYEIVNSRWGAFSNDPRDLDEAMRFIKEALDDKSPFANDVLFFALRTEIENQPGAPELTACCPAAAIIAILQPQYPKNRIFQSSLSSSFSDSFEP